MMDQILDDARLIIRTLFEIVSMIERGMLIPRGRSHVGANASRSEWLLFR